MNRATRTLFLGLAVGVATHFGYFAFHRAPSADSLDGQLAWMKTELALSDGQFARIKELHQASSPRLRALAAQVAQMRAEFAAFENTRRTAERVDFIEFAQFVELRRAINRECLESTRQLVLASADVMNARQRQLYLGLVAPIDSSSADL